MASISRKHVCCLHLHYALQTVYTYLEQEDSRHFVPAISADLVHDLLHSYSDISIAVIATLVLDPSPVFLSFLDCIHAAD